MVSLRLAASRYKPRAVHAYIDLVQVWHREPFSRADIAMLRDGCGSLHVDDRRAAFGSYRQRLQLAQPSDEVVAHVAAHEGASAINNVELSLDLVFADEEEKREAEHDFSRHSVQKHHRREAGVRFVVGREGTSRYTGQRWRHAHVLASYSDKPSRVTGEPHVLHLDWRSYRLAALRRMGIREMRDLVGFDHRAFWSERLQYAAFDEARLGRVHNNWRLASKRRAPWSAPWGPMRMDMDLRVGGILARASTTQEMLDAAWWPAALRPRVRACLVPLDVSHLLPASEGACL